MKSLKEIEESVDFSAIVYKGFAIWMLVRSVVCLKIVERDSGGYSMSFRTRNVVKLLKNGITGIFNLFLIKKFDYWFFANTDKRNLIDGKFKDAYFDDISDRLGQEKSLFVEYTLDGFKSRNSIYSNHIISDLVFKLASFFIKYFICLDKIENLNLIKDVLKQEKIEIDLTNVLKNFFSEYQLYKFIFKYSKPKAIFVYCYYSKIPIIVAAHDYGIKVIEYQHGVIGENNEQYNTILNNNKRYFPDLLLTFGRDLINNEYANFIYYKKNIVPLGSSYMENIKIQFEDNYLKYLKNKYSKIICVTSSGFFLDKLMCFIKLLSIKNPNYLFIIRKKHQECVDEYLSDNIILLPQYNIYHILKYSDYNITIGSFVAYEADYYGVNNILLNINSISDKYIANNINKITVNEDCISSFDFSSDKKIFTPSDNYFVGFSENIDNVYSVLNEIIDKY